MKAVLLAAPEGGTGKTTLAGSLALALRCVKREVVVIDLDPRNRLRLHYPVDPDDSRGIANGLVAGSDWNASIFRTREGIDLLPFGRTAGAARRTIESALAALPEQFVGELVKRIPDFDRVLVIDTPSAPAVLLEALRAHGCLELVVARASPSTTPANGTSSARSSTSRKNSNDEAARMPANGPRSGVIRPRHDAGAPSMPNQEEHCLSRPEAQRRLATHLESGFGVAKDPVEARAWLEITSRGGDEEAKALLASREKTPAAVAARIEALEKEITPAPAGEGREILRFVERALATASGGTADGMRLPGIAQALAAVSGKTAPSERQAETAPTQHRADAAALPNGEPNADTVREIQRLLAIAHYDPGAATGVLNERTRAAIRRYQRTMGLPDDGLATPALLERLRKDASPLRPPGR